jgi:hypothetical protein
MVMESPSLVDEYGLLTGVDLLPQSRQVDKDTAGTTSVKNLNDEMDHHGHDRVPNRCRERRAWR